eukprot:Opistho-2@63135
MTTARSPIVAAPRSNAMLVALLVVGLVAFMQYSATFIKVYRAITIDAARHKANLEVMGLASLTRAVLKLSEEDAATSLLDAFPDESVTRRTGRRGLRHAMLDPNAREADECQPALSVVRAELPSPDRDFCHGIADIRGPRECTIRDDSAARRRNSARSAGLVGRDEAGSGDDGRYLLLHPYKRLFEVRPFFFRAENGMMEDSLKRSMTIVVQATLDRVYLHLLKLVTVWKGPVSIAVLLEGDEEQKFVAYMSKHKILRMWVDVHLVERHGHLRDDKGAFYPINALRNVALDNARTEWILVSDLDVMPNARMSIFLRSILKAESSYASLQKQDDSRCPGLVAYIPPAVELPLNVNYNISRSGMKSGVFYSKEDATTSLKSGQMRPMHTYFSLAYMPTRYGQWMEAKDIYEVPYSVRFEPYFIARRDMPRFNDSFVNRGGNFAQLIFHMHVAGYRFVVLPDVFVIDQPHDVIHRSPFVHHLATMWASFSEHVVAMYNFKLPEDSKASAYLPLKTKLADELRQFPGGVFDPRLALPDDASKTAIERPAFTLLVTSNDALWQQFEPVLLRFCQAHRMLWGIVILWNDPEDTLPMLDEQGSLAGCGKPVHFRVQLEGRITHAYRPSNIPREAPDCVLIVGRGEGWMLSLDLHQDELEFALDTWQTRREQIVGFRPAAAMLESGADDYDRKWRYVDGEDVLKGRKYNFIVSSPVLVHRRYFDAFFRLPREILRHVDVAHDCDDIALNFAVSHESLLPPAWVDTGSVRTPYIGESEDNPEMRAVRSKCIGVFMESFDANPLVDAQTVLRLDRLAPAAAV